MTPRHEPFRPLLEAPTPSLTQKASEKSSKVDTVIHLSSRLELVLRIL